MYDEDTNPGHPPCDVCGEPASCIFADGVCLCATHNEEARALQTNAAQIEWHLTSAGSAYLGELPERAAG